MPLGKIGMKNIYLEPNEEITTVIDRLSQIEENHVNLVVPSAAQIWQSSINLKLLKRETDSLGKEITFIIPNDLGEEIASKIGFTVKKEENLPIETVSQKASTIKDDSEKESDLEQLRETTNQEKIEPEEETQWEETGTQTKPQKEKTIIEKKDIFGLLIEELNSEKKIKPDKTAQFAGLDFNKKPERKMADIITPGGQGQIRSPYGRFLKRRSFPKPKPRLKPEKIEEPLSQERPEIFEEETIFKKEFTKETKQSLSSRLPKFFIIFIGAAVLTAGLVAFLVLPNTEIIITPKVEEINFDLSVIGSRNISQIDESLNKIPLEIIKVEKTANRSFPASGEKEINEKAQGMITIYNEYSSSQQTLVATTRFESPEGKVFRITKNIIVPGAQIVEGKIVPSSIKALVVADQSGELYNISPTNFTIPGFKGTPKYAGFYAKSQEPMSGGFTGKVKIVTENDLTRAEEVLTEELNNEINQTLNAQIPQGFKLIEENIDKEIVDSLDGIEAGAEIENFTVQMEATLEAMLFKEEDLKKLVDLNLLSIVPQNKSLLPETQKIVWDEPVVDWVKGEAYFQITAQENVVWQIDSQALKKDLAGLSEIEVREYLTNRPEIEKAKVTFWPFWVKSIPQQEKKIEITLEL